MKVRRPSFDFSETPARWSRIPEFAQMMNSSSLWIPHLERFLNRVMAKALTELKSEDAETKQVKADVRLFIRQEANHYTQHAAFNEVLPRNGYDVAAFEQQFEAEFDTLYKSKSLKFLAAYCEGFETLGPPSALVWHDEIDDLLEGARPEVVALWKWHLAEEYEHRHVCHDVLHALKVGYFMRIYGLFYQLRHLTGFSKMVLAHLNERDYASMTAAERKASKRRAKMVSRKIARLTLPRVMKALSPFYSPRTAREPKALRSYMEKLEAQLA